ncbi:MAG: PDZ domain-containing protein, partial [Deltaproteobacteria bacterium]|nr:PDZ domain-containing protein [Nannocystaceae bacterium]
MKPPRALQVVAVLLAFATGGCGRTDASTPTEDSPGREAGEESAETGSLPQPPDLSQHPFPLLIWAAFEVEQDYFDKQRLDPRAQLVAATAALGLHMPEFFAEASGDTLQVRVRSAKAEFALGDVTTLVGAATRLEEVLGYADSVLDLEPAQRHELEYAAINGLFGPLDPHTVLLTPEQHADLGVRTKGEFGGVGAQIRSEARRIVIISVMPEMPAAKAGVMPGDVVLTIDGESTVNMSAEEAQQKLRGPVGTPVMLRLQRARKQLSLKVDRDTIRIESVRAVRLPDDVAYLAVAAFQESTAAEARTALTKLGTGVRAVVLDLRGNSGGVLTQATEMIDDYVAKGELVVVRSAEGDEVFEAEPPVVIDERAPVVVLLDENAASAAEIVGGGLQALGRAVVLGRTSFGKGTVQMVRAAAPYKQELALKLTLAEWLVAGGRHIQSAGVVPDLVLQPVELSNVAGVVRFYDEERFERARERSRASHLPSAKYDIGKDLGQAAEQAALHLRYLAA